MRTLVSEVKSVRLLTVPEVADALQVPLARVYQLVRHGLLPGVYVGRQVRVDPGSLEEWVAQGGRQLPAQETDSNH